MRSRFRLQEKRQRAATSTARRNSTECAKSVGVLVGNSIFRGIGSGRGLAHDQARLYAIHEVAPDSPLILDGNAGVSRAAASELVRGLKAQEIVPALLEQWLAKDDLAGARALGEESGWLVAADESVTSADDARRVVAERAAGAINIKLMKGVVAAALDIVAVAKSAGLKLMSGGQGEPERDERRKEFGCESGEMVVHVEGRVAGTAGTAIPPWGYSRAGEPSPQSAGLPADPFNVADARPIRARRR